MMKTRAAGDVSPYGLAHPSPVEDGAPTSRDMMKNPGCRGRQPLRFGPPYESSDFSSKGRCLDVPRHDEIRAAGDVSPYGLIPSYENRGFDGLGRPIGGGGAPAGLPSAPST